MMDVLEFLRESAPATEKADGWGASRGPVIPT